MCLAVPGEIISIHEGDVFTRTGKGTFGGIIKDINLAFVPEAKEGDYVLTHVGIAISIIDEAEAQKVYSYLGKL